MATVNHWVKLTVLTLLFVTVICEVVRKSNTSMNVTSSKRSRRAVITVQLTSAEIQELLDVHNVKRRQEGAADMEILVWNHELAEMAQEWSDLCKGLKHGQPARDPPPYSWIGQNIWGSTGRQRPADMTRSVDAWYGEIVDYHYDTVSCNTGKQCGHYTQVVWATTTDVGCGYTDCGSGGQQIICNYGPGGNYRGQVPYQLGYPCSKCESGQFWCDDGLCNAQCQGSGPNCECAALCQNCGTLDDVTCSCSCVDGWTGTDCSELCEDHHDNCGNGWPLYWCNTGRSYVDNNCPAFCGTCVSKADAETCPEVTPTTCTEWSTWNTDNCRPCGGCGTRTRTRHCGVNGQDVDVAECDPKECLIGVHPKVEWLWITSKWTQKPKNIRRYRKCCYDYRDFWATPQRLSREKYCFSRNVKGWKYPPK